MTAPTLADYRHGAHTERALLGLVPLLCPPEATALGLAEAIVAHVALSMRALPAPVRHALVAGLAAYDLGAVARHGRRAHRLSGARAARYLAWWRQGPALGQELIKGVKGLLCLACYEMPAMQERLGYRPQAWIDRVTRRRLDTYAEDIARHQADLLAPDPLPGSSPDSSFEPSFEPLAGPRAPAAGEQDAASPEPGT